MLHTPLSVQYIVYVVAALTSREVAANLLGTAEIGSYSMDIKEMVVTVRLNREEVGALSLQGRPKINGGPHEAGAYRGVVVGDSGRV